MKRILAYGLIFVLILSLLVGCTSQAKGFDSGRLINVVSREDGSGTRGAFIELTGLEEKDANGNKKDTTTQEAIIANKTDVMMQTIAGDDYSIGYISIGSLNENIKALKIDGAEATAENIKNGSYTLARPFNIATKGEPTGLVKDFIDFILSAEGQEIVADDFVAVNAGAAPYSGSKASGKIVVGGSSSVGPVMEKLIEAYQAMNTHAVIELQVNDSTAGMTGAIDGNVDIGMASRDLKDSEKAELTPIVIALDGIAVVINNNNPLEEVTMEQLKEIFNGSTTNWSELQ